MPLPIAAVVVMAVASAAAKAYAAKQAAKAAGKGGTQGAAGQIVSDIRSNQDALARDRTLFNQQEASQGLGGSPLAQILGGQQQPQPPEIPQVGQDDQIKRLLDMLQQKQGVFNRRSPNDFGGL
jgi:hypothetical protein